MDQPFIDFRLIYDEWMPPDAFVLVGHDQLIFHKGGKVRVFSMKEAQELMWQAHQTVMQEMTERYRQSFRTG